MPLVGGLLLPLPNKSTYTQEAGWSRYLHIFMSSSSASQLGSQVGTQSRLAWPDLPHFEGNLNASHDALSLDRLHFGNSS